MAGQSGRAATPKETGIGPIAREDPEMKDVAGPQDDTPLLPLEPKDAFSASCPLTCQRGHPLTTKFGARVGEVERFVRDVPTVKYQSTTYVIFHGFRFSKCEIGPFSTLPNALRAAVPDDT